MKLHIFATIHAENGKELWVKILHTGLNLTDMDNEQLVYGDIELEAFKEILGDILEAGNTSIDITH